MEGWETVALKDGLSRKGIGNMRRAAWPWSGKILECFTRHRC